MAKNAITDYSTTAADNTDVGGIGIQGTNAISNIDNAAREIMSQLADTNAGTAPFSDTLTIGDAADLTKEFRFEASGITTATTRVLTVPNFDGTIATLAGTETLTNKTLTSPVLTTPQINDTSADHQYVFAVSELAADRTVTLPLLAANDEFVFKAHHVQSQATWEAGVGTTESLVTPAKIAAAITALAPSGTAAASQAEQETASATNVYVSPGRQQFHPSAAKFWAKVAGAGTLTSSYNVTSVTDTGPGQLTITIATDFSSADWCALASIRAPTDVLVAADYLNYTVQIVGQAAGTLTLETLQWLIDNGATGSTVDNQDPTTYFAAGFGDQA
jgi:hypothetical protein